jgi:serine/threonine protein kinase
MYKALEVGGDVNIVLQHANGGDFFDILKDTRNTVTSEQVVRWIWQLLQAVDFLHRHHVGHRDISVENILLHNGAVQLMDFGQAVQTHNANGVPLRYFCASGKDYCRAPERIVPRESEMTVIAPRFSHGGEIAFVQTLDYLCEVRLPFNSIPLKECTAEPCGYQVPPADMFACGVCLFVMAARMPPWREARPADPHFSFVQAKGVSQLLKAWRKKVQPEMEDLLAILLQADPSERLDVSESLTHPLFDQMAKPKGS